MSAAMQAFLAADAVAAVRGTEDWFGRGIVAALLDCVGGRRHW